MRCFELFLLLGWSVVGMGGKAGMRESDLFQNMIKVLKNAMVLFYFLYVHVDLFKTQLSEKMSPAMHTKKPN